MSVSSASQSPSSPAGYESKYSNGHESKYSNGHGQPGAAPGQQPGYLLGGVGGDSSCHSPASYPANMRYHGYSDNIVAAAKTEYSGQWTVINEVINY